jgi:hypothetical protein
MGSTAPSDPPITLDRVTGYNTLNYIASAQRDYSQVISSEPSWTSTEHPRQPFTMVTWTTGLETPYASILHLVASYSNYLTPTPFSFFIIMIASTGGSPSPSARRIITMSSILTPSTIDIQPWRKT